MASSLPRRVATLFALAAGIAAAAYAFWPRPLLVDVVAARLGPFSVTIDEDARTRVRHIYTVSAPVTARLLRISAPATAGRAPLHVGDQVIANQTVVAILQPAPPPFIDTRSRDELVAALSAAEAAIALAEAEVRRSQVARELAKGEHERIEALTRTQVASAKALEKAHADLGAAEAAVAIARAQLEVRRSERSGLAARMQPPTLTLNFADPECCIAVRSPVSGRILRIVQESENVVTAGTPLIEIGDPADLEIVADLLSPDAVQVEPGAPVNIEGWGGPPLIGKVTRVDPAGFTKVSALGIEEQRVRSIIELTEPAAAFVRLGHDFRVNVRITIWSGNNVLTIPTGSIFRSKNNWAVYKVESGKAKLLPVKIGRRTNQLVEVAEGLQDADTLILHPSDRVSDGQAVTPRF